MINCLLFDCDGTLVDSERLCNIALVMKFNELNITLDPDELELRFKGQKLANILEQLQSEHTITLPDGFVPAYRKLTNELLAKELKPIKGIKEALDQLDYPKAVVSSAPRDRIDLALKVCGLTQYFNRNIYSAYEIGFWKPDPKIYEFAAQHMGYAPALCAVIEDSLVGVEAGVKAGAKTFFYNPHNEQCDWPDIVSFQLMDDLPKLILNTHSTSSINI